MTTWRKVSVSFLCGRGNGEGEGEATAATQWQRQMRRQGKRAREGEVGGKRRRSRRKISAVHPLPGVPAIHAGFGHVFEGYMKQRVGGRVSTVLTIACHLAASRLVSVAFELLATMPSKGRKCKQQNGHLCTLALNGSGAPIVLSRACKSCGEWRCRSHCRSR